MSKHFLNIKEILETSGVKKEEVAAKLFPKVKFPVRALYRAISGESELSASEVSRLAEILNCKIQDLYEPDRWAWKDTKDGNIIFIYGSNFRVEVNTTTWLGVIYYGDEIVEKSILCDKNTPLGEFFDTIKTKIQAWLDLM